MRGGVRQIFAAVAIIAIALHTILWGIAPLSAAPSIDPLSVICHSGGENAAQAPSDQAPAPQQACDHCALCAATHAPSALNSAVVSQFTPARLLHVLRPASALAHGYLETTPNHARGPPAFA